MNTNPPLGTIRLIYPESVERGRSIEQAYTSGRDSEKVRRWKKKDMRRHDGA